MPPDPTARPLTAFNFRVEFALDLDGVSRPLCAAAFAECDGLEVTMEPKTYREGGNNLTQIHLAGPLTYGQLTLKRGMTDTLDLWTWFDRVVEGETGLRVDGRVLLLGSAPARPDGDGAPLAGFLLSRCLPVKLKAPALNAKEGAVAIEEMQVAYERLRRLTP
jgi:phage tail-like protein